MKVKKVFLIEPHGFGGLAHYTFCLASALHAKGAPVVLLTSNRYELKDRARFEVRGVFDLTPRRSNGFFSKLSGQIRKALTLAYNTYMLRKEIRSSRPDVVHFQTGGNLPFVDWLLSRFTFRFIKKRGAKVVYTAHNILPHDSSRLSEFIYRYIYKRADTIIAHSKTNIELLKAVQPEHAPFFVVPHGDYQFFGRETAVAKDTARKKLKINAGDNVVLFFGQIMPYKGLDTLIEACGRISGEVPEFKLLIVGRPERGFNNYERLIVDNRLSKQVIKILEYVPNKSVGLYFQAADVVALPYKKTYQSGVVQLAYAFGLPVVCSGAGGLADIVKDGVNGFIFKPPDNAEMLAELLIKVLTDKALAKRLGAKGKTLARTKFSWTAVAGKTLEVYDYAASRQCSQLSARCPR